MLLSSSSDCLPRFRWSHSPQSDQYRRAIQRTGEGRSFAASAARGSASTAPVKLFHHRLTQDGIRRDENYKGVPFYLRRASPVSVWRHFWRAALHRHRQRRQHPPVPARRTLLSKHCHAASSTTVLALSPVTATGLGDHRFDDKLDDVGAAGRERSLAPGARIARDGLRAIDASTAVARASGRCALAREPARVRHRGAQPICRTGAGIRSSTRTSPAAACTRCWRETSRRCRIGSATCARAWTSCRDCLRRCVSRSSRRACRRSTRRRLRSRTAACISLIDELVLPQLGVLPADEQAQLKSTIDKARKAVSQHQIWLDKRLVPEAKGDFRIGAELYDRKLAFALDSPLVAPADSGARRA